MRVYLESLGCRLNYAEMFSLGRQLTDAGHSLAPSVEDADVCVLNSCAVTDEAARKSRRLLRQMARVNADARLVVTGCYATLEGERLAELPNVALVVGNARKQALLGVIDELAPAECAPTPILTPTTLPAPDGRTRAFIKVQDGCRNRCTFCIVTVARGEERSRAIREIVAEVQQLAADGYQEAVLTGVHLGGYGRDLQTDLTALVDAVIADTDIPRLRLSSLEPFDLSPAFFAAWQGSDRLMPHLHLPAQSGSDAVLRRMARRNTVADFEGLVAGARARIPGLTITTDIIVGFPGETEADFEQSLAFARRVGFAHLHVFPYSTRAGTAAARMPDQTPEPERRARSRRMSELDGELGEAARRAFLGQTRPVLYESCVSPADEDAGAVSWFGLTDNYLRVRVTAPAGLDLHNRIAPTRLIGLEGGDLVGRIESDERSTGASK